MKKLKMDQSSSMGASPLNIKNHQASKLGDAQDIPYSSLTIIRPSSLNYVFITYILCAMLGASFYFQFCLLFCWSYACWILALFVWERDTPRFFI